MAIFRADIIDDDSSIDKSYYRSGKLTYRVFAPLSMDANLVRNGLGFGIYSLHPTDPQQLVEKISVKLQERSVAVYDNQDNPGDPNIGQPCYVWNAEVEFGPWTPFARTPTGDPSDQPMRVEFESVTYQEIANLDKDGNPIINSAYDFFDPTVMRDRTRPIIKITRNERSFSDSTILAYADKVNSTLFYSYAERTLKCAAPRGVQRYSQFADTVYYEVAYQLEYNPLTWDLRALDMGYREVRTIGGSAKQVQIFDGQGQPIASPYFLASGVALTPPVSSSNIVELAFRAYDEIDFNSVFMFPPGILN